MPWLSILIPAYNVRPYLKECLTSVINQIGTDSSVEILILDDCSTDGSDALILELSLLWPGRLRIMKHDRNRGLSSARNTMIDASRGEYLWFLDSDDKILPGAIKDLKSIITQSSPDIVLCDFTVWREKPQLKHRLRGEQHTKSFDGPSNTLVQDRCALLAGMLATGRLHAWSKISRKSLWGPDLRFPPGRHFEDMTTLPLLGLRATTFYYAPKPWVAYRQRENSIMSTMDLSKALDQSSALLPFKRALRGTCCNENSDVQWALSQQAARCLIGALRYVYGAQRKSNFTGNSSQIVAQIRGHFYETSPFDPKALARSYLRKGWWIRRQRFLHWYNAKHILQE